MATSRETSVRLYKGVPFDDENVLFFGEGTAPETYLSWLEPFRVYSSGATCSYQRDNMYARMPVNTPEDWKAISGCNYLCFFNLQHENKNTYGFITEIEYKNDGVAFIYFTIDHWLTNAPYIEITNGLVERAHYVDEFTMNTTSMRIEQVDVGEPVSYFNHFFALNLIGYVITYTLQPQTGQTIPDMFTTSSESNIPRVVPDGVPISGVIHDLGELNSLISMSRDHPNAISDIIVIGRALGTDFAFSYPPSLGPQVPNPWTKCYKYPSMFIRCINTLGDEKRYYPEHFYIGPPPYTVQPPRFRIDQSFNNGLPIVRLVPVNYKGIEYNYDESMYYDQWPRLPWTGDTYGNWKASNGFKTAAQVLGLALGGASAVALAPTTGGASVGLGAKLAVAGAAAGGASLLANISAKYKQDDVTIGSYQHGGAQAFMKSNVDSSVGYPGFRFTIQGAFPGFMQANNMYWNAYGYLSGHVGKPNLTTHPHWNYIKGSMTFKYVGYKTAQETIKNMFARGVRLWHTSASDFGNLSLDNRA